jgi:RHS repeat-associated protein
LIHPPCASAPGLAAPRLAQLVVSEQGNAEGRKLQENVYNAAGGSRTAANGYVADGVRQQFTGHERDSETDLDFAEARYFSSKQGRFTSPDPLLESAELFQPQSWNRYSYVLNNPLLYIDPTWLICVKNNENDKYYWINDDAWEKASKPAILSLAFGYFGCSFALWQKVTCNFNRSYILTN